MGANVAGLVMAEQGRGEPGHVTLVYVCVYVTKTIRLIVDIGVAIARIART